MDYPLGGGVVVQDDERDIGRLLRRYGLPLLAVTVAFLLQLALDPLLGGESPFLIFFAAILISSWYGGIISGVLATVVAALLIDFFFLTPTHSFWGHEADQNLRLGIFLVEGMVISALSEVGRRSRERERQQRQWSQVTLSSIGDAVIATDVRGQITFINSVAQSLTGWTQREAMGRPLDTVFQIINEKTRELVESPLTKILREGTTVGLANHTLLVTKTGREISIDDSAAPIQAHRGQMVGTVLVFRDVTERIRAEELILRLQAVAVALSEALTRQEVVEVILGTGLASLGEHFVAVYLLSEATTTLELMKSKGELREVSPTFEHIPLGLSVPLAEAVRTKQPIWIATSEEYTRRYPQLENRLTAAYDGQAAAYLPMTLNSHVVGGIVVSFPQPQEWNIAEQAFMIAVAHQCAQALDRARLHEVGEAAAMETERHRLARELHDAVNQTLYTINMLAQSLPRLWESQPDKVIERLTQVAQLTRTAMAEMRTLLFELRPDALVNSKLSDLLTQLADVVAGRASVTISLSVEEQPPLPLDVRIAFYRITQEATNNIAKHAHATEVTISVRTRPDQAELLIKDNGKGFAMETSASGLGLSTMRERAEKIGASLRVTSQDGQGTEIVIAWINSPKGS